MVNPAYNLFPLMPRKRCTQCSTDKPICLFDRNESTPDGRNSLCMSCQKSNDSEGIRHRRARRRMALPT